MRHIFIINPLAGQKGRQRKTEDAIRNAGRKLRLEPEIYRTTHAGDGERLPGRFVKNQREKNRFALCLRRRRAFKRSC